MQQDSDKEGSPQGPPKAGREAVHPEHMPDRSKQKPDLFKEKPGLFKQKPGRRPFVVGVASLRSGSVSYLDVEREGQIAGLEMRDSYVPPREIVRVSARLEAASAGIMVNGTIRTSWIGQCRRCLAPAQGRIRIRTRELYTTKSDFEDAYRMAGSQIDLEPMVRDAILLELPQVPLCRDGCAGLCSHCGADLNSVECTCETFRSDPRWSALDDLR